MYRLFGLNRTVVVRIGLGDGLVRGFLMLMELFCILLGWIEFFGYLIVGDIGFFRLGKLFWFSEFFRFFFFVYLRDCR